MTKRMKECRKCRTQIDGRASICPHCRSKQPDGTKGIVFLILAGIVGFGLFGGSKSSNSGSPSPTPVAAKQEPTAVTAKEEPPPPPPTPKPGEEVDQKFFEFIYPQMAFDCAQEIKRLVKYDIRSPGVMWGTNSGNSAFFLLRFSRWSKRVASDNTMMLAGDEAEAQNGFGNWIRVNYACTINLANNTVKRATLNNGNLP